MADHDRGIDDFLSPLPQSPVPLEILERAESENVRVDEIVPLSRRYQGIQAFIYDFIVTYDGTTYGLRFEDEWAVIVTNDEVNDVRHTMEQYFREHNDERNVDLSWELDEE